MIIILKIIFAIIYLIGPIIILNFILIYFKNINNINREKNGQFKNRVRVREMNGEIYYFYI